MATELFAPSVPVTLGLSLSRSRTQDYLAQRNDKDINGKDDRWDGNMDQDAQGRLFPRPRRRSSKGYVSIPEGKVAEKDEWELAEEVRQYRRHLTECGFPFRKLGLQWNNLNVRGKGADAVLHDTVLSQYDIFHRRAKKEEKVILEDNFGVVKPGEMLLVLARPGGGSTTLLRILSNRRNGYSAVEGEVRFGSMDAKSAEEFRGQIVMNSEDEIFYPNLTVKQTIDFATTLKSPATLPDGMKDHEEHRRLMADFLVRSMGIAHTVETKVGDAYTRGVSGGERKRVSIIEVLATRGAICCWDNSTRGLDASTALAYAQAIRTLTDVIGATSVVTLYQAGNGIYDLFDKVLVLDLGKQIFYGPREQAKPFFESLGFEYTNGANFGDYLTGCVVPTERHIRKGYENSFPRTADEIRSAYQRTAIYEQMRAEIGYADSEEARTNTEEFKRSVLRDRHKSLPKHSPLTVPIFVQILALTKRQYQIIWGNKVAAIIRQGACLVQSLVIGSLFYNIPDTSNGLFLLGGTLFFSVLYNSLVSMSEVQDSFHGRPVLVKHKEFAFFQPAAFVLAQIFSDIPILLVQITIFSIVVYFMTGLRVSAAAFFTYYAIVFTSTMTMTALFRACGSAFSSFNAASKVSGLGISAAVTYAGYIIAKPSMHPWFVWIYWINPLAYALNALMSNEISGRTFPCTGKTLIPTGGSYTNLAYASCAGVPGSIGTSVDGDAFLQTLSYSKSDLWRNFGILWAWWLFFVAVTTYFTTFKISGAASNTYLTYIRNKYTLARLNGKTADIESVASSPSNLPMLPGSNTTNAETEKPSLVRNTSVLTWRNLQYTVKVPGGHRLLLDNINGYVKPGQLGALMGSSGAGKTTLLDVLAQRKTEGKIEGQIHVDGRPLPLSFQRSAGYCEQLDVHEPLATVREALEFSAILRQSRGTPKAEKLAYVDTIIDLLEMRDIEHALVGTPGAGLGVEQSKRLTIGVELVAKPSILIFLDEPTSGLDSQSAFSIVRFLRKLADVGQAILVTIHQPSASLFYQFDTLLLLAKGGKTVYNGAIGDKAATIKAYFAREGAPCPDTANVGEHMIAVVSGAMSHHRDWHQVWLASPENKALTDELDAIEKDVLSRPVAYNNDGHEFATSLTEQCREVLKRNSVSLFRNTDYVNNKIILHVAAALFNGFTFWKIGDSAADMQNKMFSIFVFIFVAPGVIAQVQPLFIARRDIFEAREKKSKMYSWWAFCYGLMVSELPYLLICGTLYFVCWWFTAGFPARASRAGAVYLEILLFEMLYTGIGQFVAAYAPNVAVAQLVMPILIGTLVSFSGVLVPYLGIQVFWRYWLYYINPFTYLIGALLWFGVWGTPVNCTPQELAVFNTPNGETCQQYLQEYLSSINPGANLLNPMATSGCQVCPYTTGTNYLHTVNILNAYDGWRNVGITAIFCISSYGLVLGLMKLRTKQSKTAE